MIESTAAIDRAMLDSLSSALKGQDREIALSTPYFSEAGFFVEGMKRYDGRIFVVRINRDVDGADSWVYTLLDAEETPLFSEHVCSWSTTAFDSAAALIASRYTRDMKLSAVTRQRREAGRRARATTN